MHHLIKCHWVTFVNNQQPLSIAISENLLYFNVTYETNVELVMMVEASVVVSPSIDPIVESILKLCSCCHQLISSKMESSTEC